MGSIGELIGGIGELGFQMTAQIGIKIACIRLVIFRLVFYDAFENFPGEVKTGKVRVASLEEGDNTQ